MPLDAGRFESAGNWQGKAISASQPVPCCEMPGTGALRALLGLAAVAGGGGLGDLEVARDERLVVAVALSASGGRRAVPA